MTIDDKELLVALGDQIYATMRLADLISGSGPKPPHFEQVVLFPLGNALDYIRTLTGEEDVSKN